MKVVRHETEDWTSKPIPKRRVSEQFAKPIVEDRSEPALPSIEYGQAPMNDRISQVVLRRQSLQMISLTHVMLRRFVVDLAKNP